MLTELLVGCHDFQNSVGKVLGVGGHESDTYDTLDTACHLQNICKVVSTVVIRIHVLTQENDFAESLFGHLLYFPENLLGWAAAFPTPRIGYDAVGTVIITSPTDGYPSADTSFSGRKDSTVGFVHVKVCLYARTMQAVVYDVGEFAVFIGSDDTIDERLHIE